MIKSKLLSYYARFIYSVLITIFFALFNAFLGVYYSSIWYGSIAIYFIVLALLRVYVFIHANSIKNLKNEIKKLKKSKILFISGIVVIFLDIALLASIIQMITSSKPTTAGTIAAIANAAYAFYKITIAIINVIKAKKIDDDVNLTIRCIFFADSLVSILSLTVTLLSTFGEGQDNKIMIICVSMGVSLLILSIGLYMLINGLRKIKALSLDK